MNRPADDDLDASSGGIRSVLVRRLPDGEILRCGTVHTIAAKRGQTLVVQTDTGLWLAECLVDDASVGGGAAAGEWLRVADEQDLARAQKSLESAAHLRTAAEQLVMQASMPIVIVAVEVDLHQHTAIVRFLGRPQEQLGPLAVRLADACDLQRVQWTAIESGQATEPVESSDAIVEREFWQQFDQITAAGESLGKAFRVSAGNRGLYQQKRRGPSPSPRCVPAGRSWMLRVRTAAGGITASQLCSLLDIAQQYADGSLRLTIRQAIQLHGVAPQAGDDVMQQLAQRLLTTVGSCGNSVRNLTCCPLPLAANGEQRLGQREVRDLALRLANDLLPRGPAFEFRFAEQRAALQVPKASSDVVSSHSLPHKFKVGVASDRHDCADVLSNDLAFIVRTADGGDVQRPDRVDLYVGGSTAYRTNDQNSFPCLATYLGTAAISDALAAAEMLIGMFARRDESGPRHFRRWKYVVRRTGLETLVDQFRQQSQGRVELGRETPAELDWKSGCDGVAPHAWQGRTVEGLLWRRWMPPAGRITAADRPMLQRLRDADATVRVGTQHDLITTFAAERVSGASLAALPVVMQESQAFQVGRVCPALPTCPLAVAAAETEWPQWAEAIQRAAHQAGVQAPPWAVSGCTNGCSRPLTCGIGLIAESPTKRAVFLGGSSRRLGQRVGCIEDAQQLVPFLAGWLGRYGAEKSECEGFSDWFWRKGRK